MRKLKRGRKSPALSSERGSERDWQLWDFAKLLVCSMLQTGGTLPAVVGARRRPRGRRRPGRALLSGLVQACAVLFSCAVLRSPTMTTS